MTTRRNFLDWHGLYNQLVPPTDGPTNAPVQPAKGHPYLEISRQAMATDFVLFLNTGQYEQGKAAALDALDIVSRLENRLSYFRSDSEISQINREAAGVPALVGADLVELLELCAKLTAWTDGAFDITSTALWECWGFSRREGAIPAPDQIEQARLACGMDKIQWDADSGLVTRFDSSTRLNLGSIGKGYALDRAAGYLIDLGVADFLFHGGKSSIVAVGNRCGETGWKVGLHNPLRQSTDQNGGSTRLLELSICDAALATSGSQTQFFTVGGKRYGHILDPRTGYPAQGVYSVTVIVPLKSDDSASPDSISPSGQWTRNRFAASEADALATAFYILGPDQTERLLENRPDLTVLFVLPSDRSGEPQIVEMGRGVGCLELRGQK